MIARCLLLPVFCLLPTAFCLLLTVFRCVVEGAALHDELFVVGLPVAVDINFDEELALLAVADIAGVIAEAVLVAQERVDRLQDSGDFAFKGDGVVGAARLFGECLERVLRLQEREPAREAGDVISRREQMLELLEEKIGRANDVDGHARILRHLTRLVVVDFAESVHAGGD